MCVSVLNVGVCVLHVCLCHVSVYVTPVCSVGLSQNRYVCASNQLQIVPNFRLLYIVLITNN